MGLPMRRVNPTCELGVHCKQSERGNRAYRNFCGGVVFIGQSRTTGEDVPRRSQDHRSAELVPVCKRNRRGGTRARGCEGIDSPTHAKSMVRCRELFIQCNRGVLFHEVGYVLVRYSGRRGKIFSIPGSTDDVVASEVLRAVAPSLGFHGFGKLKHIESSTLLSTYGKVDLDELVPSCRSVRNTGDALLSGQCVTRSCNSE